MPPSLAVLIDNQWKKTSGYTSPELRAPDGTPAILITPQAAMDPTQCLKLLVHEITHLIHYKYRGHEEAWVREGVAMLAEYIVTGYFNAVINEGFTHPETSLIATHEPDENGYTSIQNEAAQYGHVEQYFYYIYKLCGKERLFLNLLQSESHANGMDFIDERLNASQGSARACRGFGESFRAFELARFLDSPLSPEGYVTSTRAKATVRSDRNFQLPPYSAAAYQKSNIHEDCERGEIPWGQSRCIRIRF